MLDANAFGGWMTQLYFTDGSALRAPVSVEGVPVDLSVSLTEAAGRIGLMDGMPFFLDRDGSYLHEVNRFFRACPTMGVRSRHSLRAYAHDIFVWIRFLEERRGGKQLWRADYNDVIAFHHARRLSDAPFRISASSWNRAIAALDKLYRWALEEGLIASSPFRYDQFFRHGHGRGAPKVVEGNRARERAARRHDMQFVDIGRYLAFRDIGLRGRLPDGSEDPAWRGRNGERNAVFAELLVTTGMRLGEAGSLIIDELPRLTSDSPRILLFDLPGAITKGERPRRIRLPRRVLKLIGDYCDIERHVAAAKAPPPPVVPFVLSSDGCNAINGSGRRVALTRLRPQDRQRLLRSPDGMPEHASLWLTERGQPVSSGTWEVAFRRASQRCQIFGLDVTVTPHMLRHTFAVNMLSMLIREQVGAIFNPTDAHGAAYRQMLGDPLRHLQHLLGHTNITSTYIYLDSLAEAQELVDAAADRWTAELMADDR
ncbi:integrase domain protein SAM domain protein [Ruegeria sp. TrichCH4B]|nr:integrase domain protein SAM domain protein [Ruegeria sp. TrichCH4B]